MDSNRYAAPSLLSFSPSLTLLTGSFHLSLLAGRVLLKDFSYHSSNQTIKIVKVQIRWQYWSRSLTTSEAMHPHSDGEEPKRVPDSFV
jgi:hypothetical protein